MMYGHKNVKGLKFIFKNVEELNIFKNVEELNTICVAKIKGPPFFIDAK